MLDYDCGTCDGSRVIQVHFEGESKEYPMCCPECCEHREGATSSVPAPEQTGREGISMSQITIRVADGYVETVEGIPFGVTVRVEDYDTDGFGDEETELVDGQRARVTHYVSTEDTREHTGGDTVSYTKGPWTVYVFGENREHINVIRGTVEGHEFEQTVAMVSTHGNEGSYEESLANARAIAELPALLEAAQQLLNTRGSVLSPSLATAFYALRKAVDAATGEE